MSVEALDHIQVVAGELSFIAIQPWSLPPCKGKGRQGAPIFWYLLRLGLQCCWLVNTRGAKHLANMLLRSSQASGGLKVIHGLVLKFELLQLSLRHAWRQLELDNLRASRALAA